MKKNGKKSIKFTFKYTKNIQRIYKVHRFSTYFLYIFCIFGHFIMFFVYFFSIFCIFFVYFLSIFCRGVCIFFVCFYICVFILDFWFCIFFVYFLYIFCLFFVYPEQINRLNHIQKIWTMDHRGISSNKFLLVSTDPMYKVFVWWAFTGWC